MTLNLPAGAASTLALGLVTVNPFSKFALTMDPVSRGSEKAAGIDIGNKGGDALKARAVRTGLGAGALLTAAKVPFFAVFMSLILANAVLNADWWLHEVVKPFGAAFRGTRDTEHLGGCTFIHWYLLALTQSPCISHIHSHLLCLHVCPAGI